MAKTLKDRYIGASKKIGGFAEKAVRYPFSKVGRYLRENKKSQDEAAKEMDRRYPSGWSQSAQNMKEWRDIRKGLRAKR